MALYKDQTNSFRNKKGIKSLVPVVLPEKAGSPALFDCRVWTTPTLDEAANVFLWRERDATKNSISMAARCYYSHKELLNKSGSEMQEMLFQKGVNWNDYPDFFKRGTFVQRRTRCSVLTPSELEALPPLHDARKSPDLMVMRSEVCVIEMPPFNKVKNRVAVLFDGTDPVSQ